MSDETEIIHEEGDEETEAAAKALTEAGDEAGALRLKLDRAQRALKRERDARKSNELSAFKGTLATEFPYADPDLIVGRTEAEMRASAERLQQSVARVIEKNGLKPAPKTEAETEAAAAAKGRSEWGAPPPVATEAVTGEAPMDYSDMIARNREGKLSREEILRDLRENGAVRVSRQQSSAAIRGRGEPAQTA